DGIRDRNVTGVQTCALPISGEPEDAEAGAEALLGVRALVENEVAQSAGRRPDRGSVLSDARDGPAGVAPMAGGHVLRHGGVFVRSEERRVGKGWGSGRGWWR